MNITDEKKIEIRLKALELSIGRATLASDVIGTAEEYYQYLMGEQPKSDLPKQYEKNNEIAEIYKEAIEIRDRPEKETAYITLHGMSEFEKKFADTRAQKEKREREAPEKQILDLGYTKFAMKLSETGLHKRFVTYLERNKIIYLGDLVQRTADDISCMYGCGPNLISDLKVILTKMGFEFGMIVPQWTPTTIKMLRKILKKDGAIEKLI